MGDTLLIAVIALDSAGREVARIAPWAHLGGTERAGQVLWRSDGGAPTPVVIDRPGLVELVARLAHRADTMRIPVPGRPGR